jgi:ferric-dicitrate binding protein FerR (iron transport regulator)
MTEPGYTCSYDLKTSVFKTSMVDIDQIISWKDGRLVFRNEPFDEVVKKINRWYNVNCIIKDDTLESYAYRAIFVDETLDEVLKLLKLSAPIDYKDIGRNRRKDGTFEKRVIELYFNP